jgi:F-type H+-transporting ATPase subunit a
VTVVPTTLAAASLLDHVLPHELFHIGPITVTNHRLMMTIAAVLMLVVFFRAARAISVRGSGADAYVTKGRVSQIIEVVLVYLRDEMARPVLGKLTDRYIGYIWTTFFFILFCNLLGMVPWSNAAHMVAWVAGVDEHSAMHLDHWQGTPTGNINVTGALAIVSFFMILFVGIRHSGLSYFAHFAPVPLWPVMKGSSPAMLPVAILLIILEIMGQFIKPFALAMRLFANMLAGHMVLGALIALIFIAAAGLGTIGGYALSLPVIAGSLAMSLLELFVAFLQAYIFAFLTVLFIAQGAVHEHEEHDHEFEPHDEHEHLEDFAKVTGVQ